MSNDDEYQRELRCDHEHGASPTTVGIPSDERDRTGPAYRAECILGGLSTWRRERNARLERFLIDYAGGGGFDDDMIVDAIAGMLMLAVAAGIDFDDCVKRGKWHVGCDALFDVDGRTPSDLYTLAAGLEGELAGTGHHAEAGEIVALAADLDGGRVLSLTDKQLELLKLVRAQVAQSRGETECK